MSLTRCPNCKVELLFEGSEFCEHCGVKLDRETMKRGEHAGGDDDMEFVVTEDNQSHPPELVGGFRKEKSDELGLQSSAELMAHISDDEAEAIPPVAPAIPAATAMAAQAASGTATPNGTTGPKPAAPDKGQSMDDTGAFRRLSPAEVKAIEKNMYAGTATYLSEDEKRNLLKNMSTLESAGVPNDVIVPPKKQAAPVPPVPPMSTDQMADQFKPAMAKRGRGVAYFLKNYIQVQGDTELHDHDELTINERTYVLRKKKFSSKATFGAAAVVFTVVLLFLSSLVVMRDTDHGSVIGVVLDSQQQPYAQGATIRFPDLGKSYTSNPQGFFRTDPLPPGSHKIEFAVDGGPAFVDYATVTADDITTITLRPGDAPPVELAQEPASPTSNPAPERSMANRNQTEPIESPSQPVTEPTRANARLTLAANVEGARLAIDGSVVGAGNLTFTRLKPGSHSYSVSKEGYETASGTVDLAGGKTSLLAVTLTEAKAVAPAKPQSSPAELAYAEGQAALTDKNYSEAITAFSNAIAENPNYGVAHLGRGKAYQMTGQKAQAHDDYIRAAEIYRFKKDYDQAVMAYNKAIEADPKSVTAYLGRGDLYLEKQEEIAATADYETVIRLDRRNTQAYIGLGEARYSQGNFSKAIKHFRDAKDLAPNNPQVYEYLMLAYLGDGDLKNVRKTYEKYKEVAGQEQMDRLAQDKRFSAVLGVVGE